MSSMADVPIQIINGTNGVIIQVEDPSITLITLIATIVLAAASIAGVAISVWQTKKSNRITKESNDLLRTEITARLRPIVFLSDVASAVITKSDGKQYLQVKTTITNNGTVPLRNLRVRTGVIEGILLEHIVKSENELKTQREVLSTFLPNRSTTEMTFDFSLEEIEEGKDLVVFWFNYKYLDFEEDAIQTLLYNRDNKSAEPLGYHTAHDILDARKFIEENERK